VQQRLEALDSPTDCKYLDSNCEILQETHHSDAKNLNIPGFVLFVEYTHEKLGIASFV